MLLSLRESPVRFSEVSCDVGCCSSFQFCSSFCCFCSFCCCCSSHCFSTSSLTFPWTIPRFLHPFYTFSPAHRRAIRDTFILSFPRSSLHSFTASATVLSGHFLLTDVFYLTLLHRHFTCVYQCLSLGAGSSSLKFAVLHTEPRNTDVIHLFVLNLICSVQFSILPNIIMNCLW